jgi:hypothetical protein
VAGPGGGEHRRHDATDPRTERPAPPRREHHPLDRRTGHDACAGQTAGSERKVNTTVRTRLCRASAGQAGARPDHRVKASHTKGMTIRSPAGWKGRGNGAESSCPPESTEVGAVPLPRAMSALNVAVHDLAKIVQIHKQLE